MTTGYTSAFPRRDTPEFCINLSPQRAQGMPGAQRTRSLACKNKKAHKHSHHGHIGITRHSPRDGFNRLPRALPGDQDLLTPSLDGQGSARLTPTLRRQDHTLSPSAGRASSPRRQSVHRNPVPRFVTSRAAPLEGTGRRSYTSEIPYSQVKF